MTPELSQSALVAIYDSSPEALDALGAALLLQTAFPDASAFLDIGLSQPPSGGWPSGQGWPCPAVAHRASAAGADPIAAVVAGGGRAGSVGHDGGGHGDPADSKSRFHVDDAAVFHKTQPAQRGQSCDEACAAATPFKLECDPLGFYGLNDCQTLKQHFECRQCEPSVGYDQPAQVSADAAVGDKAGKCLFDDDLAQDEEAHKVFDHSAGPRAAPGVADRLRVRCGARHPDTLRLCPCVGKSKH